jgi:hypothetical protein
VSKPNGNFDESIWRIGAMDMVPAKSIGAAVFAVSPARIFILNTAGRSREGYNAFQLFRR